MRKLLVLAALVGGVWSVSAPVHASGGTTATQEVIGLKLVDDSVFAEAYYNGSSFSGGGIMSAIATYRVTIRDSRGRVISRRTEERNVSLAADWESSDPNIYPYLYYPGQTLNDVVYDAPEGQPDGLWVYGGDSTEIGTTTITATFEGFTATGTITFWAD